jgi:hypothetical protein
VAGAEIAPHQRTNYPKSKGKAGKEAVQDTEPQSRPMCSATAP